MSRHRPHVCHVSGILHEKSDIIKIIRQHNLMIGLIDLLMEFFNTHLTPPNFVLEFKKAKLLFMLDVLLPFSKGSG